MQTDRITRMLERLRREEQIRSRLRKLGLSWLAYLWFGPDPLPGEGPFIKYPAPFPLSLIQHLFPRARWFWPDRELNEDEIESQYLARSWPAHLVWVYSKKVGKALARLVRSRNS